jgi:hypothetical protein
MSSLLINGGVFSFSSSHSSISLRGLQECPITNAKMKRGKDFQGGQEKHLRV